MSTETQSFDELFDQLRAIGMRNVTLEGIIDIEWNAEYGGWTSNDEDKPAEPWDFQV